MQQGNNNSNTKRYARKAGRTLLVKTTSDSDFNELEGLQSTHLTEKTNSHFLTFDTITNAVNALRTLKNNQSDIRVKFAHYRVFFTMQGLNDSSDYNTIKTTHVDFIQNNTGTNVLYYKLYRKNNSYLECGDLTVDTKDAFDKLMNSDDGHKTFSLDGGLSGMHYRYNRKGSNNENTNHQTENVEAV